MARFVPGVDPARRLRGCARRSATGAGSPRSVRPVGAGWSQGSTLRPRRRWRRSRSVCGRRPWLAAAASAAALARPKGRRCRRRELLGRGWLRLGVTRRGGFIPRVGSSAAADVAAVRWWPARPTGRAARAAAAAGRSAPARPTGRPRRCRAAAVGRGCKDGRPPAPARPARGRPPGAAAAALGRGGAATPAAAVAAAAGAVTSGAGADGIPSSGLRLDRATRLHHGAPRPAASGRRRRPRPTRPRPRTASRSARRRSSPGRTGTRWRSARRRWRWPPRCGWC